jgi:hypothetical protein
VGVGSIYNTTAMPPFSSGCSSLSPKQVLEFVAAAAYAVAAQLQEKDGSIKTKEEIIAN